MGEQKAEGDRALGKSAVQPDLCGCICSEAPQLRQAELCAEHGWENGGRVPALLSGSSQTRETELLHK